VIPLAGLLVAALLLGGSQPAGQDPASGPNPGFPLVPGSTFPAAGGYVALRRVWSPFEITVTQDGTVEYDAVITATGLPPAGGDTSYVAWLTTPAVDRVVRIGTVSDGTPLHHRVRWNQVLVVVTRESGPPGARWGGPTVLVGRSRSALIRPLWGHSLFRRTPF
jgi:hypothetical protein